MYNEERKQEYLRYVNQDLEKTTINIEILFKKTEQYEELFNKDLCDFVFTEIDRLLPVFLASSVSALRKNISIMKKYTNWCCSCNLSIDNINHYDEIDSTSDGLKKYLNKESSICPTRDQVLQDISKLRNYSDKFLILALFEGVRTKDVGELLRVKKSKLKGNILTFENGEERILSPLLVDFAEKSSEEEEYISLNGTASLLSMDGNIVNSRKNVRYNSIEALNKRVTDRLIAIRRQLNIPYLTTPRLNAAGIANELRNIMEESNISKTEVIKEEYLKMVNPNYGVTTHMTATIKNLCRYYL